MSEIPKAYEPQAVEEKWYQFWLDKKCFVANPESAKPKYSIVIPPPNVTGMLHMGHVLNNTIQDILSRKARMDGKEVLWLPGTDHAGIATQVQVEKALKKEERKTKYDLGREEFLKRVWVWKEKHGGIIINQLKKLGSSCDWTRERFTMDPEYSACVQKVFVELYKKGLIYRGKRMVNWCPVSQTALSDEEVEMKPQKGFMYHFKVEVAEAPGTWLTIATTRPETIPGDTAVAVNPKDARYAHLIGKHIIRPLPIQLPQEKKLIPIIGDEHVDFEFGTGVLKVTPAHDKADFEIGQRHKLAVVDIMNPNGTMNDLAGESLAGLDRFEARKIAVERLKELGAMVEEKPYENNVGFSQRADVPIEPRLSEQWFLKYPAVPESKACVAEGKMKFHPERWAKTYDHWLSNIQDWCISRQLWWGHRIPVWSKEFTGTREQVYDSINGVAGMDQVMHDKSFKAEETACTVNGVRVPFGTPEMGRLADSQAPELKETGTFKIVFCTTSNSVAEALTELDFTQDPDVLDTWFSSWLWPFATMGWPEKTSTLKAFYPTTDLVTGPDIIFFWVARMIMAGFEYMGELPFHNVYFTGIIRDKQGRKMSKTLGNSPDPLVLIGQYGADALRFGTMRSAPLGQDVLFDENDVELGRNFCNKLWNASRFRQMQGGEVEGELNPQYLTNDDKWILLRLDQAIREVSGALESYKFNEATAALYRFFWNEFCDWYLETCKTTFYGTDADRKASTLAVIDFVLSNTLRLFHPFVPFITEELWQGMGYHQELPAGQGGETIMYANWPKPFDTDFRDHYGLDDCYIEYVERRNDLIVQGRNLRRAGNLPANKRVKFVFKPLQDLTPHDLDAVKVLLNAEALEVDPNYQPAKGTPSVQHTLGELYLPLEGLIDPVAETARLTKEVEKISSEIEKVQSKLNNPGFTQKVPPAVLEDHQKRLV
ncbi:MAG: vals: valine--trna ligase, partial [Verrucomicrobiales bacterium]|nr:vals: valine--trna ligase [Verrucomicrobiales bacterium]